MIIIIIIMIIIIIIIIIIIMIIMIIIIRGIFQGDSLSPLLFIISLIPLTMILNKMKHGYQFSTDGQRINHLLYMDDLKLYSRAEKELNSLVETVRIFSKDINMAFKSPLRHSKMCTAHFKERKECQNGRNSITR